jgi:hypothetical protein
MTRGRGHKRPCSVFVVSRAGWRLNRIAGQRDAPHGQTHSLQEPSLGPTQRQVPQSDCLLHWPQNETLGVGNMRVVIVAYFLAVHALPASMVAGHAVALAADVGWLLGSPAKAAVPSRTTPSERATANSPTLRRLRMASPPLVAVGGK